MILENVCIVVMGQAPNGLSYNTKGEGIPLIAGASDLGKVYPSPSRSTTSPNKLCKSGDIILCIRATIGNKNWADSEYCLGRGVAALRTKNAKILDGNYLWHWLTANEQVLKEKGKGATFLQVTRADIAELPIILPPFEEQRRIGAILDKADAMRCKRQEALKLAGDVVKSQFVEMFGDPVTNPMGWERGTIRDIADNVRYGTSKPASENGKYTYLRMNNITYGGELDLSALKSIDMPDSEAEKYIVRNGDVLFNRTNSKELVGKTCVFNSGTPMIIAGYIIRVRVNHRATPTYLSAFLNSDYGKLTLRGMCKSIIGQANINAQELQNIKISIPPIELQNQFARFVDQADKSKFVMQCQLDEAEATKNALMQEYF